MRISIELTEWWTVSCTIKSIQYDQREGRYESWDSKSEMFPAEKDALKYIEQLKREGAKRITLSHVKEIN